MSETGIKAACAAAGSQIKLAQTLGVTESAVSTWVRRGWVPLRRAQEIEATYGIARRRLVNPRIFDLMAGAGLTQFDAV